MKYILSEKEYNALKNGADYDALQEEIWDLKQEIEKLKEENKKLKEENFTLASSKRENLFIDEPMYEGRSAEKGGFLF